MEIIAWRVRIRTLVGYWTRTVGIGNSIQITRWTAWRPSALFTVEQCIETNILSITGTCRVVEKFCDGLDFAQVSPARTVHLAFIAVGRNTVFKALSTVLQNVLAYTTEVKVQITTVWGIVVLVERIHHPELDEFYVLLLKIVDLQWTHDTRPAWRWIRKCTVST